MLTIPKFDLRFWLTCLLTKIRVRDSEKSINYAHISSDSRIWANEEQEKLTMETYIFK
uniref:Uncharacterized protein n=1 Tax=Rhizophora mucronata TaxID=61149 RepID=A0A2P2P2N1_RHIMU